MRKSKKIIISFLGGIVTTSLLFIGCGEKVTPPEETAKAFYNLYMKDDSTEMEKIGFTKDEINKIINSTRSNSKEETKKNFSKNKMNISDAQLDEIYEGEVEATRKLAISTEVVSSDNDTAKVKITSNYIDFNVADKEASDYAIEQLKNSDISSEEEYMSKASAIYVTRYLENLKTLIPSTETKENIFEFEKKLYDVGGKAKKVWIPKDIQNFSSVLWNDISKK